MMLDVRAAVCNFWNNLNPKLLKCPPLNTHPKAPVDMLLIACCQSGSPPQDKAGSLAPFAKRKLRLHL